MNHVRTPTIPAHDVRTVPKIPSALAMVILFLLPCVAYFPSLRGVYLWDDNNWLLDNPVVQQLRFLPDVWLKPGVVPQYYPMVFTTFAVEWQLWGAGTEVENGQHLGVGYHVVNMLLHALAAVGLFKVIEALKLPGGRATAWLAAALWAVHPVNVESVAWVVERKNVLCAAFLFPAFLYGVRFLGLTEKPGGRKGDYALALGMFLLAMFSKTAACFMPPALLVLVWYQRGRVTWREALATVPFFAAALGLGMVTAYVEHTHAGTTGSEWEFSLYQRVVIAGNALWFYLGKLAWPFPVMQIYPRFNIVAGRPLANPLMVCAPVAFVVMGIALFALRGRMGRGPFTAVLLFSLALFPVLGFISFYTMTFTFVADHYQYLAAPAVIVLGVELGAGLFKRLRTQDPASRVLPMAQRALAAGLVVVLSVLSWGVSSLYRSAEQLWAFNAAYNPSSAVLCHQAAAMMLAESPAYPEIQQLLGAAMKADPAYHRPYELLYNLAMRFGDLQAAAGFREEAERRKPEFMRKSKAQQFEEWGKLLRSEERVRAELRPARKLEREGKWDDAIEAYRRIVAANPLDLEAALRVVYCLRMGKGDAAGAQAALEPLLAAHPESADAWFYQGWLRDLAGDEAGKLAAYQKALQLDSQSAGRNADLIFAPKPPATRP